METNGKHDGEMSADKFLKGGRRTQGYRSPQVLGRSLGLLNGESWFNWTEADLMRRDPQVIFGMAILRAPLYGVTWNVKAPTKVAEFVNATIQRVWQRSLRKVLHFLEYGVHAGEITHTLEDGLVRFDHVWDVHPRDARPLEYKDGPHRGDVAGLMVNPTGASTGIGRIDLLAPHAWWFPGNAEFGGLYSRPAMSGAYLPWKEKRGRNGAIDSRRLWYKKCAFHGPRMRYPDGSTDFGTPSQPNLRSNQDVAREIAEKFENGGILALPNDLHSGDASHFAWEWEDSGSIQEVAGLREYPKDLDREILIGLGIPPELVEAATVGSGYSGRAIPAQMFFTLMDEYARLIIQYIDQLIIRPLITLNFGRKTKYEILVNSLAAMVAKEAKEAKGEQKGGNDSDGDQDDNRGVDDMSAHGRESDKPPVRLSQKLQDRVKALADAEYPDLPPVRLSTGDPQDWHRTKTGKGEYSPSTGRWRPIAEHLQSMPTAESRNEFAKQASQTAHREFVKKWKESPHAAKLPVREAKKQLRAAKKQARVEASKTHSEAVREWKSKLRVHIKNAHGQIAQGKRAQLDSMRKTTEAAIQEVLPGLELPSSVNAKRLAAAIVPELRELADESWRGVTSGLDDLRIALNNGDLRHEPNQDELRNWLSEPEEPSFQDAFSENSPAREALSDVIYNAIPYSDSASEQDLDDQHEVSKRAADRLGDVIAKRLTESGGRDETIRLSADDGKKKDNLAETAAIYDAMLQAAARVANGDEDAQDDLDELADLAADEEQIRLGWIDAGASRTGKKRWKDTETGRYRYQESRPGELREKRERSSKRARELSEAIQRHLLHPQDFPRPTKEQWQELADHLPALTVDGLRNVRNRLLLAIPNKKRHAELVQAIQKHVNKKTKPTPKKAPSSTVYNAVLKSGGVDAESARKDYNLKEDFVQHGLSGIFRSKEKGGQSLDELASSLEAAGHIKVPDDRNPDDYLVELLQNREHSLLLETRSEYDSALDDYYKELENAKQTTTDRSEVEEALRLGEEAGQSEGEAELQGEDDGGPGHASGGDQGKSDSAGQEDDLDFNFGANSK
jgi:hypothetical protein